MFVPKSDLKNNNPQSTNNNQNGKVDLEIDVYRKNNTATVRLLILDILFYQLASSWFPLIFYIDINDRKCILVRKIWWRRG